MISILVKNKGVRKVGRLTEMTQHLVNGWEGGLFYHMKEVSNMTVKEIFKLIHLNENVSIIDKKDIFNSWSGDGKNIPLKYGDCEVKDIYSESLDYGGSGLIITIKDKGKELS